MIKSHTKIREYSLICRQCMSVHNVKTHENVFMSLEPVTNPFKGKIKLEVNPEICHINNLYTCPKCSVDTTMIKCEPQFVDIIKFLESGGGVWYPSIVLDSCAGFEDESVNPFMNIIIYDINMVTILRQNAKNIGWNFKLIRSFREDMFLNNIYRIEKDLKGKLIEDSEELENIVSELKSIINYDENWKESMGHEGL